MSQNTVAIAIKARIPGSVINNLSFIGQFVPPVGGKKMG